MKNQKAVAEIVSDREASQVAANLERRNQIDEALARAPSDDGEDLGVKMERLAKALGQ